MKKLNLMVAFSAILFWSCNQDSELNEVDKNSTTLSGQEIHMCTEIVPLQNSNPSAKPDATIFNSVKWATGQTIRIKFLNGDNFLQEKVKLYAKGWMAYANINFQFVSSNEAADVKVAFKWNGDIGSWSHLGTRCQSIDQNTPSINFGWFDSNTTDTEFSRTIVHEFGHMIGLIHEHQSPVGNILWDKPKVYEYYQRTQGWTTQQVDNNIFAKYSTTQTNYSTYDNLSIMHYPIDASLTTNGYAVGLNTVISNLDMNSINQWYPFPLRSTIRPSERFYEEPWTQPIQSPNGMYRIQFYNGVLRILNFTNRTVIWEVGSSSYSRTYFELQSDGNFVIRGRKSFSSTTTIWSSETSGNPGAILYLQDDGNLVLFYNGIAKWSSKSGKL